LLRLWSRAALTAALLCGMVCCCARAEAPLLQVPEEYSADTGAEREAQPNVSVDSAAVSEGDNDPSAGDSEVPPATPSDSFFSKLNVLGLRHSSTSGRNVGMGIPLTGTSWLNRPYYVGGDLGTVWITNPVKVGLTTDTDMFGGVFAGCDWDYYWGTELALNRATPELKNERDRDAKRGDTMTEFTTSMMYYPWGDAVFRPYWRCGMGVTSIDYPTEHGHRRDEELWTFPMGIGMKFPIRRWLAARAEFADQLALGNSGIATQHDLTLTFGLEWRFGLHPKSYWPWNPSDHIW
jgi:hypothetical protein